MIDTHAHLDEEAFSSDLESVLQRATDSGVDRILTIGTTLASSRAAVDLAEQYEMLRAAVGLQPNYVAECGVDDWQEIVKLCQHPGVIAIGETGLDRYWDFAPLELQRDYFLRHLELSAETGLPFIVHCREAESDVVAMLRDVAGTGQLNGVMHSFCGDASVRDACLDLGMMISFAGMVTFKRNHELRSVAADVPADRLLVETDAPYLAPVPCRGKRNEPAMIAHTVACLAEARDVSVEDLAALTAVNARRFFSFDRPAGGDAA